MNKKISSVNSAISTNTDVTPAKDLITEETLINTLESSEFERQIPEEMKDDLFKEMQEDTRFGERWSMQKAMCLLCTDYPDVTNVEMAYLISQWFDKKNYGLSRATIDIRKFKGQKFNCQKDETGMVEVETVEETEAA